MRYRTLGRSGLRVGEIGVGCEGFLEKTPEQVREWLDVCEAAGINCIDLYAPNPDFRSNLGRALRGRREKFVLQAISAPSGRTGSTSGPGTPRRSGRASRTSSGGWRRTMWKSA